MATPCTVPLPDGIPPNHREHTESKTTILVPTDHTAFLNPTQQFNRDLSVAVIRAWNERRKEKAETRWRLKNERKKGKAKGKGKGKGKGQSGGIETVEDAAASTEATEVTDEPVAGPSVEKKFRAPNIKIIEALSATGLRSIRYAKEIPDIKYVLANDLSSSACDAMRMNVAYNGVGEDEEKTENGTGIEHSPGGEKEDAEEGKAAAKLEEQAVNGNTARNEELPNGRRAGCKGKVRVNEGDACTLMYSHREPKSRVEVVDLDPYGTAAPFTDAALGCISDGGLLCVTCTDVAVLAGSQYPEKAYSNYGGACVNAEYSHEVGLRLVLNSLSSTAARYGRYITPLLSFSIDFYVRLFVVVNTGPNQVKDLASHTGIAHVCGYCQTYTLQPLGRIVEKDYAKGEKVKSYKSAQNLSSGGGCPECGGMEHVAGPMWLAPIHDKAFTERVLKSIEGQQDAYGTWTRMHGMLTIARDELEYPFYFTCNKIGSFFRSTSAPTSKAINALLNAGYNISRSHAAAGSVKTNAPRSFVFDIVREFIKTNPVRMDRIPEQNHGARNLLARPQTNEIDFTPHPNASKFDRGEKVVFYQNNPLPNWGPGSRAKNVNTSKVAKAPVTAKEVAAATVEEGKRKAEDGVEGDFGKKAKVQVETEVG